MDLPQEQHNNEIMANLANWRRKPVLQKVYADFYRYIATFIRRDLPGDVVELGSGIGNLKSEIPDCICTDLFANPWIDRVENAYQLEFTDGTVSNLVLFDVFHHLEYPGTALREFHRVLTPGGRVILFEPAVSLLGRLVYGVFHHEPLGLKREIRWFAPEGTAPDQMPYYAAQGNASRIFLRQGYREQLTQWNQIHTEKLAAWRYIASGGYGKPQLYPTAFYNLLRGIDRLCGILPSLFAVRLVVVLEKK